MRRVWISSNLQVASNANALKTVHPSTPPLPCLFPDPNDNQGRGPSLGTRVLAFNGCVGGLLSSIARAAAQAVGGCVSIAPVTRGDNRHISTLILLLLDVSGFDNSARAESIASCNAQLRFRQAIRANSINNKERCKRKINICWEHAGRERLASDLIDLGQSIKRSIEKSTKVGENRRRIRDLTHDVLRTLADLSNLTQMHEDTFQALALLDALGSLKADMSYVLSARSAIPPVHRPGLNGFPSNQGLDKAW
ncbi:hypothetical protein B0H13DRAFT_2288232 [Mycena leptocephala]|nr:hypothetical protein B0H13DRAFT_2288232 [Mycena leptocephala]